jgi:hypothetical protein
MMKSISVVFCKGLGSNQGFIAAISSSYCVISPALHSRQVTDRHIPVYCLTIALNVINRTSRLTSNGMCIIGVRFEPLVVFTIFDAALNLCLTFLFIIPLQCESRTLCFLNQHSQG